MEKISDIEKKYYTIFGYNNFTHDILDAKIKAKKLVNKFNTSWFINNTDLDEKIKTLATKAELKAEQDKKVKLQKYDSSIFIGQSYFVYNGAQNYLIFQRLYYILKRLTGTGKIVSWKSKCLPSERIITPPPTTTNSLY